MANNNKAFPSVSINGTCIEIKPCSFAYSCLQKPWWEIINEKEETTRLRILTIEGHILDVDFYNCSSSLFEIMSYDPLGKRMVSVVK